jgi:hypothetical protein
VKFYYLVHWSDGTSTRVDRGARGFKSATRIAMAQERRVDMRAVSKHPNTPSGEFMFAMRQVRRQP